MINAILNVIIKIIFFIIKIIINIVFLAFPEFPFIGDLARAMTAFFELLNNASAMTYFLVGTSTPIIITTIITLNIIRHIALPIINFTRKILIK